MNAVIKNNYCSLNTRHQQAIRRLKDTKSLESWVQAPQLKSSKPPKMEKNSLLSASRTHQETNQQFAMKPAKINKWCNCHVLPSQLRHSRTKTLLLKNNSCALSASLPHMATFSASSINRASFHSLSWKTTWSRLSWPWMRYTAQECVIGTSSWRTWY